MAQASKRLKRLRRLKRDNSKLRQTVRVIPGMVAEQLNKAYGELLPLVYALLAQQGDMVTLSHSTMEDIRAQGPQMRYTVEPGAYDETETVVRLVRPALTVTKVPEPVDVPVAVDTFTCDGCHRTFPKAWSEHEANAEAKATFGMDSKEDPSMAVLCDDCYKAALDMDVFGEPTSGHSVSGELAHELILPRE